MKITVEIHDDVKPFLEIGSDELSIYQGRKLTRSEVVNMCIIHTMREVVEFVGNPLTRGERMLNNFKHYKQVQKGGKE